jgi:adenylyltransferase/sulfurtransferase
MEKREIEVCLPALLSDCTRDQSQFMLEAETVEEALRLLTETYPLLRVHLYDESRRLRQHVMIFYNADSITWLERLDIPIQPGDRLQVVQAVSGG